MTVIKFALALFGILFLTACNFNKIYLRPTKLSADTKKIKIPSAKDTVYVWLENNTHQPVFLKNNQDTIDLGFTIESVVFKSKNKHNINGWMLKPKNAKPTTTLLHFHGNAGFLLSQYRAITPLLKNGFQIFMFDYSGFGFSSGKATRKNVLIDANSALSYVKERPDVKNTKLIIYGQSLGGHLSAVVAQQRQSEIDALVIEGAFSSHQDIAAKTAGIFGRILVKEQYSARKFIKEYKKPVLVIHSTEDATVPFDLGRKLFSNANEPKEFYEIKKCHICGPKYYTDSIAEKIIRMIK